MTEFELRMVRCLATGHDTITWRIRIDDVLYVRLLCRRCGLTMAPLRDGATPLVANKNVAA